MFHTLLIILGIVALLSILIVYAAVSIPKTEYEQYLDDKAQEEYLRQKYKNKR